MTQRFCSFVCVFVFTALFSQPVRACVSDQYDSVHFNSGQPDYGTLPRRAILIGEGDTRTSNGGFGTPPLSAPSRAELNREKALAQDGKREKRARQLRILAQAAIDKGNWNKARTAYLTLAQEQGWAGDLRARSSVLVWAGTLGEQPATAKEKVQYRLLRGYFRAMDAVLHSEINSRTKPEARALFQQIAANPESKVILRLHVRYQLASLTYDESNFPQAVREYNALLKERKSAAFLRESALIMLARAAILPQKTGSQNVSRGADALRILLAQYPDTRFRKSAQGLRARVDFLKGRYTPALAAYLALNDLASVEIVLKKLPQTEREKVYPRLLAAYLRKLNQADDFHSYEQAAKYVRETLAVLTPSGAKTFVGLLLRDPTLPAPYFYYRLYHCENTPKDLRNLARLAARVADANSSKLSPLVQVRLAEVFYQDHDYAQAVGWANRALASSTQPFDRALYVRGAVRHKQKQFAAATEDFAALLARCPNSGLRVAAREEMALLREASGDLNGALDQYFFLDYQPDIAYFLDARMTTAQVAGYVAARPNHAKRDLLAYSLGMRYLRDENWASARRWLTRVPKAQYARFSRIYNEYDETGKGEATGSPSPLSAVRDLSQLQYEMDAARGTNARAAAQYKYASYYYKNGTLLLYNAALWNGRREVNFDFWWNQREETLSDLAQTRRYMYAHETYARAQKICDQIARDYPRSPSAPLALYRAACAANRLGDFNGWWRDDAKKRDHVQEAANRMQRLAARYPKHPLAKGARKFARVFNQSAASWLENRKRAGT